MRFRFKQFQLWRLMKRVQTHDSWQLHSSIPVSQLETHSKKSQMNFIPQYPPNSYRTSRQIPKSGEGCPIKPTIWLLAEVPPSWAGALSMDVPLPWGWRFGNGIKGMPWDAVPSASRWIWLIKYDWYDAHMGMAQKTGMDRSAGNYTCPGFAITEVRIMPWASHID